MVVKEEMTAVPADLYDGAGVMVCNPERAQLVARLRDEGVASAGKVDFGDSGQSAVETVAEWGVTHARILSGPRDDRAAKILLAACEARGIDAVVVAVPDDGVDDDEIVRVDLEDPMACFAELARPGRNGRLAPARVPPSTPARRSPIPAGIPWEDSAWHRALLDHAAANFPLRYCALVVQLGLCALGANPIEDAYAGNGLRDRNRELLVNIV